ncbi:MAG: GNAT family N-acetyltransferase [Saprospiraceae bacterium]|nr:GNAT family N-acetyltransferase [Saprospiraceae bacterium]MCB9326794.1 GNAT family N-acetyltransferase [Lewinellaceae bacterium]
MDRDRTYLFDIDTALVGRRIVVRRFRENEGSALYQLIQDNYTMLYDVLPKMVEECISKESAETFVRRKIADWLLDKAYCFGIWETKGAELIGYIEVFGIDWHIPKGELAFFIDMQHKEKGIMTEALKKVTEFSFNQLQLEKLAFRVAMDNYPAQRLARKCEFSREGDLRNEFRNKSGALIDAMLFGLPKLV